MSDSESTIIKGAAMPEEHCRDHSDLMEYVGESRAFIKDTLRWQTRIEEKLDTAFEKTGVLDSRVTVLETKSSTNATWWGAIGGLVATLAAWVLHTFFGSP